VSRLAIVLIGLYQRFVSPYLQTSCIYHPSCSAYAAEAYRKHGFLRGSAMASRRLLRCWPWCSGGYDPVP
jgi:uncharacterized protein